MGELTGHALDAVQEFLTRAQVPPCGPPFTRYLAMTDEVKRAETGFPVEWAIEGGDLVVASQLPPVGWPAWSTRGPYENLMEAHNSMVDWIRDSGPHAGRAVPSRSISTTPSRCRTRRSI